MVEVSMTFGDNDEFYATYTVYFLRKDDKASCEFSIMNKDTSSKEQLVNFDLETIKKIKFSLFLKMAESIKLITENIRKDIYDE